VINIKKRILFIGGVAFKSHPDPDGVTIRNRHLLSYLKNLKGLKIKLVDSYNWRSKKIRAFINIIFNMLCADKIILSTNSDSAYKLIKLFNLFRLKSKVLYFRAGGAFEQRLKNNELRAKYFQKLRRIYVQSKSLEHNLSNNFNLKNVEYLPNFKYFKNTHQKNKLNTPLKGVYFGRIHPKKGINYIFDAIGKINLTKKKIDMDFYGPIASEFSEKFYTLIEQYDSIDYKGIIDFENDPNAYKKLSEYDVFVFPSFWPGEGFPGVFIDAFISGLPIIASNWNHNASFIEDGVNGYIFELEHKENLVNVLHYVLDNSEELINISRNNSKKALEYLPLNVLKSFTDEIYC